MGFLFLWLKYDCGGDIDAHRRIGQYWNDTPNFMYDERCAVRDEAMMDDTLAPLFEPEIEREPWTDEVRGEPFGLVGF